MNGPASVWERQRGRFVAHGDGLQRWDVQDEGERQAFFNIPRESRPRLKFRLAFVDTAVHSKKDGDMWTTRSAAQNQRAA